VKRRRSCNWSEYEIAGNFCEIDPISVCKACLLLRQDGGEYLCGFLSRQRGKYVNTPPRKVKQVKLLNRVVIDGKAIPAGTALTVIEKSSTGEGYWCKNPLRGNLKRPPFFVPNRKVDDGGS